MCSCWTSFRCCCPRSCTATPSGSWLPRSARVVSEIRIWPPWPAAEMRAPRTTSRPRYPSSPTCGPPGRVLIGAYATPMNRLAQETSPYLLQHAGNPVDWQPWGDEAFSQARESGKPLLVSIGYSACHWCHVMERESFEDEATAVVMN